MCVKLNNSKTEIKNRKLFIILCIIATLIMIYAVVSVLTTKRVDAVFDNKLIERSEDQKGWFARGIDVTPGSYQITINYNSSEEVRTDVKVKEGTGRDLLTDNPTLKSYRTSESFKVWVRDSCKRFDVELTSDAKFTVDKISVKTASNSALYKVSTIEFFYVLTIGLLAVFLLFKEQIEKNSRTIIGITVITLVSSVGLFMTYIFPGHDLYFHLQRIDGLADAISAGEIPSRVQTTWCYDWGYAVSAMYGDTTLIIPAIMRTLGFPLVTSYKVYAFLVNLGTAIFSYKVFEKLGGKKNVALFVAFLYTCSPYRLECIYVRSAVGEYTAMMFLPLVLLVIKYIYYEDIKSKEYGKKLLLPALTFSMLVQTHILSCVMTSIFLVLFAVIQFRKTFRKKTILYLSKIAIFTLLITLWFIIPLIMFYREPFLLHSKIEWKDDFHYFGITFTEMFAQRAGPSTGFNRSSNTSLNGRMPLMLGNGFVLIIVAAAFFVKRVKLTVNHIAIGVLTLTAILMTTIYFPYNLIHRLSEKAGGFLSSVQFPYRFLTISTILLSVIVLFGVIFLFRKTHKIIVYVLIVASLIICFDQSMSVVYTTVYNGATMNPYDGAAIDPLDPFGVEYLYDKSDLEATKKESVPNGENTVVTSFRRIRNSFDVDVTSTGTDAFIEAPVFAYPGYSATESSTGKELNVTRGNNNRVRVKLDPGYEGTVEIRYKDLPIWVFAEVVSLLAFAYLITRLFLWKVIEKKKPAVKTSEKAVDKA